MRTATGADIVSDASSSLDLEAALGQFDRAGANVEKLENIWRQIEDGNPSGITFGLDSSESENLIRTFVDIADHLPAIDGFRLEAVPLGRDDAAQGRLDAWEMGEPSAATTIERSIQEPGMQLAEYRFRLERARRSLVRGRVMEVVSLVDQVLRDVVADGGLGEWRAESRWGELSDLVSELNRLVGSMVPGRARWEPLERHLHFGQSNDLSDIVTMDWPSVRGEVETSLYDDTEPLPIEVDDLGDLARAQPTGPVRARLEWPNLSPERFESLIFDLIRQSEGYENVNWLMPTSAPDRGRDVEAYRVFADPLSGTRRDRIIVQCKHWPTRSVGRSELIQVVESVKLWEPPLVATVVVATTGRFSQDAVALAEKRSLERSVPGVELWPDSHLEALLARRPSLVAGYKLR